MVKHSPQAKKTLKRPAKSKKTPQKPPIASDIARVHSINYEPLRWQLHAIMALQEATEAFMVHLFEDA
ncbi:hypothetical protein HDV06_004468 [Boothiomyces sp. JEL0866]|nr:hypothetical protein HDV06_004468 [Boothiomyces sp. JEL0866]